MLKTGKFFIAFCAMAVISAADGAQLSGTAAVNVTSDTATVAKNMAMDEARRQIITDALGQYANREQLRDAISSASASELTGLIASSGIDGEKLSDTTYSANITMTLDRDAARKWLTERDVQNWLPMETGGDTFVVLATLTDKMSGWMDLNRIARAQQVNIDTKQISGSQVMFELPAAARASFTIALRDSGWRYSASDGVLRISK